ncbi:MAG: DUF3793 family protein [Eubacteriales bacterium]|nr:DUF3793 family protein [Eubacteriales bacterium]
MSDETLVRFGSPTLAGLKTGSLFTCEYNDLQELSGQLRDMNRKLVPKGLRLLPLRRSEKRVLLYLYRPDRLEKDLSEEEARDLLQEEGYPGRNAQSCLQELIRRLRGRKAFPHEIGLFLSYPPEDVRGFIRYKGRGSKLTGCWQVYGDAEAARRTFECFDRCTRVYCRCWSEGVPLTRLAVAGTK